MNKLSSMQSISDFKAVHLALFILRVGFGISFVIHGVPKLLGGPDVWIQIGKTMELIGVHFLPSFWGFMAGFAETLCGTLLVFGLITRMAALGLLPVMMMALIKHVSAGDHFGLISHPLESGFVFVFLLIVGAGTYSLDYKWFGDR